MNIILGFLFIPKGWLYVILSDIFITYCNNYNEHISGGGLIALFGAHLIHYDGAGGLATIIMAFVAGMQWRKEGWGDHNPVTKTFKRMWIILEPVIFALIGTEIQIDKIDPNSLGMFF